jgi:hypothetical protein
MWLQSSKNEAVSSYQKCSVSPPSSIKGQRRGWQNSEKVSPSCDYGNVRLTVLHQSPSDLRDIWPSRTPSSGSLYTSWSSSNRWLGQWPMTYHVAEGDIHTTNIPDIVTYLFSMTNSGKIAATTVSSTIATRWALHSVDDKQSSIEAAPPGNKGPRMIPVHQ